MDKWRGTLRRVDLGPGTWVLESDDGKKYTLYGDIPNRLLDKMVQIEGQTSTGFGFGMAGEAIEVQAIKPA